MLKSSLVIVLSIVTLVAAPFVMAQQLAFAVAPTVTGTGNSQPDANALADAILGAGITRVGDAVLVGVANQQGTFSGGATSVGFDSGIILTSGDVNQISGTNDPALETLGSGDTGVADDISTNLNTTGDSDLDLLIAPVLSQDANSLAITFQFGTGATGGDVKFNYRACGEEYINFGDGQQLYNDPFALFVDGTNIAKLPGGTTAVSINNVNPNVNKAFYENNVDYNSTDPDNANMTGLPGRHLDFHWDGCSVVLTAEKLALAPGNHTLKVAVADASDHILDYGVFIQAGSVAVPDPCDGVDNNGNGIVDEGTVGADDNQNGVVDEAGEACPNISINNVSQNEGNSGTTDFNFTVTRLGDASGESSVDFDTADGTALLTSDYSSESGTLNFAAGETTKTVTVGIDGDTDVELDETFFVNLSNCVNCTITDGQGLGTIVNDDFAPGVPDVSINNVSQNEGNSGTTNFDFSVTRTGDLSGNSTVTFATADDTATQPSDYASNSGTVSFASGEATKTVTVVVNGDTTVEPNETFNVDLANCAGCNISDNQGVGTILNDDSVIGDVDQDGVPDNIDQCPTVPGPAANNGCPVTQQIVGGEILGIDATSLFVAGAFANAFWILPVLAAIGAALAALTTGIIRRK